MTLPRQRFALVFEICDANVAFGKSRHPPIRESRDQKGSGSISFNHDIWCFHDGFDNSRADVKNTVRLNEDITRAAFNFNHCFSWKTPTHEVGSGMLVYPDGESAKTFQAMP